MRYPKNALQKILEQFHLSEREVLRIPYSIPEKYLSRNSAQGSWRTAIKTSGYRMKCITLDNVLYIIKLEPDHHETAIKLEPDHHETAIKLCSNCMYSLEDGFYNPEGWTCNECVRASRWRAK